MGTTKKEERRGTAHQLNVVGNCGYSHTQISSVVREQMIASLSQHTEMIYCECHSTISCQWPQASLHVLPIRRHTQTNVYNDWNNLVVVDSDSQWDENTYVKRKK